MQIHEDLSRDDTPKTSSDRFFGLLFFVVFLLLALWPLLKGKPVYLLPLGIALAFLAVALIVPKWLAPLNRLWMKFGELLHRIVSPVILGIMFFGVITPMGLAMRALGKDPLRLRRAPEATTYWIDRQPPGPAPESLRDQF